MFCNTRTRLLWNRSVKHQNGFKSGPFLNRTSLFSFQASATGGLGSVKAEVMADTAVALASANVQVVSRKVIGRLDTVRRHPLVIDRTVYSPDLLASLSNSIFKRN